MTTTVVLPRSADEMSLGILLRNLPAVCDDSIVIDFQYVRFYIPGALVALLARIHKWRLQKKQVRFINIETCPAFQYLQRVDFFSNCEIPLEEQFTRRDSTGRFVAIKRIGRGGGALPGPVSTEIAKCIDPGLADSWESEETGLLDYVEYSISELATNVVQHSLGYGFISAQYNEKWDRVRIGIADCGIGILQSFAASNSPHWHDGMTDFQAICKALEPKVSCKSHLPTPWGYSINAGVGLTLLKSLASTLGGTFCIASYSGYYSVTGAVANSISLPPDALFEGTLCAISFQRTKVTNFNTMLYAAKTAVGLFDNNRDISGMFQ